MPEPDVIQQQRAILREFRKATARRAQVEADAEARSKADRTAADSALSQARGAADGHLGPARQAQEAARDLLSKAGLLSLLEQARPSGTASTPGADPARELARSAAVAAETPKQIQAGIEALEARREAASRRRRILIGVVAITAVAVVIAGYVGYRALRIERIYRSAAAAFEAKDWQGARTQLEQLVSIDSNYKAAQTLGVVMK